MSRTHLTIAEKNEVRRLHQAQSAMTQSELLEWVQRTFNKSIGRSTLGNIVREPIETNFDERMSKRRQPMFPEVDAALLAFIDSANRGNVLALTDEVLWTQAKLTADVSLSWIQRFKKRHGLVKKAPQAIGAPQPQEGEESEDVDVDAVGEEARLLSTVAAAPSATDDQQDTPGSTKRQAIDIQTKQQVIMWITNEGGGVASRAAHHFRALGWDLDPGVYRRWWRQKDEIMASDATKKRVKGGGRKRLSDVSNQQVPDVVRIHASATTSVPVTSASATPMQQALVAPQQYQPPQAPPQQVQQPQLLQPSPRTPVSNLIARPQKRQRTSTTSAIAAAIPTAPRMNQFIDHTLLKADAQPSQVRVLCEEAAQHSFCSVCVNASYASYAREVLDEIEASNRQQSHVKVCCVVGFPLGATTSAVKAFEAKECLDAGAEEIDMVINVGRLVAGEFDYVLRDICAVVAVCKARKAVSKVILETALLTAEQIEKASELAIAAGADFIKTSTGFSTRGASEEDVKIMAAIAKPAGKQVKASGGIRSAEDAQKMVALGATRLGTSAGVKIVQGQTSDSAY